MNTEMTLLKRGIRKVDSLTPSQRGAMDSMEVFSRVADTCYFDEYGILRFENKEDRVNEEFLRLAFGEETDAHIPNEEGEIDAHIPNEEGEEDAHIPNEEGEEDAHIPNEEGEEDAHIPNEEGEQNDNLSVGSAGEYKSPFMEQFDNSRSFSVSLL